MLSGVGRMLIRFRYRPRLIIARRRSRAESASTPSTARARSGAASEIAERTPGLAHISSRPRR
nr:hypothetical protein [Streptomyces cinnamoneus]